MALVVFGVGHRALFITQDNSPEAFFFAADEGSRATYERFERTFGADEVVLVDLPGRLTPARGGSARAGQAHS